MAISYVYELYVDGERKFYSPDYSFYIDIGADMFVDETGNAFGSYSYEAGAYLGWTTTQGGTTPDYVVGEHISVTGKVYLYTIPAVAPTTKTIINGLTPIKKMFGTTEIVKEVLNGVTVYEKQASGYTASFTRGTGYLESLNDWSYMVQYSLDNGATYNAFTMTKDALDYYIPEDITGITHIKFRVKNTGIRINVKVKQGNTILCQANSSTTWVESNNIELSANTSFEISCILDT